VSDHISDLQWDRLLFGELSGAAGDAARAHAAGCTACASRLRELTGDLRAFQVRPVDFLHRVARPARLRMASLVPVLATAVVLWAVWARPGATGEQAKGAGPKLLLVAGRSGVFAPVRDGDAVGPGEHLQAGYTSAQDGFGAVLSRDGAGAVAAYVPAHGDTMVALPAGTERSFPQSTILDNVVGRERIVIVWCETSHALSPLLAELRAGLAIAVPTDCTTRDLVLDKRLEPR
jgi:hypothetical protein